MSYMQFESMFDFGIIWTQPLSTASWQVVFGCSCTLLIAGKGDESAVEEGWVSGCHMHISSGTLQPRSRSAVVEGWRRGG